MKNATATILSLMLVAGIAVWAAADAKVPHARSLYVNPDAGNDAADGMAATKRDGHGPFKTIARAVRVAEPGDTIHLAKAVYTEPVGFYDKSGKRGKPITLDGHDAVISGCVPLD